MALRFDRLGGEIGDVTKTPQGGIKAPAYLTRAGVFVYEGPQGEMIREYRPPAEVFHADSLATLVDATVTLDHPPEGMVTPENYQARGVGHLSGSPLVEGDKLSGYLAIQGAAAIQAIEAGTREVSCGYKCEIEETPGISPEGERYDRIQRKIRYNHIAIVEKGRAGSAVRLRLDSAGNQVLDVVADAPVSEKVEPMKIMIGGVEYEAGSDEFAEALAALEAKAAEAEDLAAKLAEAEALAAKLAEVTGEDPEGEKTDKDPEEEKADAARRLDAAVRARVALIDRAREFLGREFKADGLTDREIRIRAIQKVRPDFNAANRSDDAIAAVLEALEPPRPAERADADDLRRKVDAAKTGEPLTAETIKSRIDAANKAAWMAPLAFSKAAKA